MIFYMAQCISLKENSHFHQDRPHGLHFLFENLPTSDFQIGNGEEWKFGTETGPIWNMHAPGRPAGPAEVRA